jgi:hypothetical protein
LLHTFAASGIVDRDVRTESEVSALESQGVHVLALAEIENVLCLPQVISAVAVSLEMDPSDKIAEVTHFIADALRNELDTQVALRAARRIRYHLSCYSPTSNDEVGVTNGVDALFRTLDVQAAIEESRSTISNALESGDLVQMLKVYNRKSIADRVSTCFGMRVGEYPSMVIRMLTGAKGEAIAAPLRDVLPMPDS